MLEKIRKDIRERLEERYQRLSSGIWDCFMNARRETEKSIETGENAMPLNDNIYSITIKTSNGSGGVYTAHESRKLHPKEWEFGRIYNPEKGKYIMLVPESSKIYGQAIEKMHQLASHIRLNLKECLDPMEYKAYELDLEEWNQMVRQRRKNANRLPKIS